MTIRKAAALAGVSHAAPAYHFPTLNHLRGAVAAEGFRLFKRTMEEEIARGDGSPRQDLFGAGRGYQRFAHDNPGLFALMFGGVRCETGDQDWKDAADAAFQVLRRVCAPLVPGRAGAEGNELLVWSIVHGLASLSLADMSRDTVHGTPEEQFDLIFPDLPFAGEDAG